MARILGCGAFVIVLFLISAPVWADEDQVLREISTLQWQSYPTVGKIGSVAQFAPWGDLRFLDSSGTSRFLELNGNPPRPNNYTIAPASLNWFAVFAFNPTGYVRDDEGLDPDQLLQTLRRQNEAGMAERRRLGFPILKLQGWAVAPRYDVKTHRLEWGTRLIGEDGGVTVNYTIRLLGRSGVMSAVLVSDPNDLEQHIEQFRTSLRGFTFVPGERYAEFHQGDRVAEYGLAALIVGGAAAAAASSGAMKGLGKVVAYGVIAGIAAVGAFFRRLFRRKPRPS